MEQPSLQDWPSMYFFLLYIHPVSLITGAEKERNLFLFFYYIISSISNNVIRYNMEQLKLTQQDQVFNGEKKCTIQFFIYLYLKCLANHYIHIFINIQINV